MSVRSPRARLRLEPLADRCLPTTFTVTNLLDAGPGSLRDAVAAANASPGADAIDFAVTGTITLTTGQLDVADALTVTGPGAAALAVSGNHASRVFRLVGSPTVSVADLTVADGMSVDSPGGGISMAGGALALTRCTVTGNDAVGSFGEGGPAAGGGLYVAGGTLTLDRCTVSGNTAAGGAGWGGVGTFVQAGGRGGRGAGGGLYVAGGTVSVDQSTVSGNRAQGGRGGDGDWQYWTYIDNTYGGDGGDAAGGGVCVAGGRLEVRESTVSGNTAEGGTGGYGSFYGFPGASAGGGLDTAPVEPPVTYLDSVTVANTVHNTPDDIAGPYVLDGRPPLTVGDVTAAEGNGGTTAFVFTVRLSVATGRPVTVNYATADGTATAGSDYVATAGTLTIPAGQTTGTITVPVTGDRRGESGETFFLNLDNAVNAQITRGQGVGTIVDDEPRASVSGIYRAEGHTGTTPFDFTVTLSGPYDEPVVLGYATADGTATAGSDYRPAAGTLTIPAGRTTGTITVLVNGDRIGEPAQEVFFVDLGGAPNAVITGGRGGSTILDDEPRISIGDVTRAEGRRRKTTLFTFTVALSAAYDQPVTVSFRTTDGTATASDGDYVATSGTLTFAPGETTKTITIRVNGDGRREADETFYLDLLGNSSNSLLLDGRGVGTIVNDD